MSSKLTYARHTKGVGIPTDFENKVFSAVKKIPQGRVSTYSIVAKAIGHQKAYRTVGNALNKNTNSDVPCHRIVRSDGTVGGFAHGAKKKILILETEGISIANAKVKNLENVLFRF